jgi:hypothetical protein
MSDLAKPTCSNFEMIYQPWTSNVSNDNKLGTQPQTCQNKTPALLNVHKMNNSTMGAQCFLQELN